MRVELRRRRRDATAHASHAGSGSPPHSSLPRGCRLFLLHPDLMHASGCGCGCGSSLDSINNEVFTCLHPLGTFGSGSVDQRFSESFVRFLMMSRVVESLVVSNISSSSPPPRRTGQKSERKSSSGRTPQATTSLTTNSGAAVNHLKSWCLFVNVFFSPLTLAHHAQLFQPGETSRETYLCADPHPSRPPQPLSGGKAQAPLTLTLLTGLCVPACQDSVRTCVCMGLYIQ